jgi:deazaflavin-dependent oxidoreductase (nitroreductase family)
MGKLSDWIKTTLVPWYTSLGLTKRTITLEVIGRKSGKPRKVTVATVVDRGSRYLVSMHGESHWVRNVRAADGEAEIISGRRKPVRLIEIPVHGREYILLRYIQQGSFGQSSAQIARLFGLEPNPTVDQVNAVADEHPVFRIAMI